MELFILLITLGIFSETSYLTFRRISEKSNRPRGHRKVYVDTSALIDGRILEVTRTGFISDDFIIPRSVTRELQLLADGKDLEKRARARDGLDVVSELERVEFINTEILDDSQLERTPVDERLLILAKENRGVVLTCDYNLEKVAATEGVQVLNINDLGLALGTKYRPGDRLHVKITEKGHNAWQGVGHLHDGTMVIVDGANDKIGQDIDVAFLNFHQTSSGRMIFAEVPGYKRRNRDQKQRLTGRRKTMKPEQSQLMNR